MDFYEFQDFRDNPDLVYNEEACESLLSQLLVSLNDPQKNKNQTNIYKINQQLYQLLFLANKHTQEHNLDAPAAVNIDDKGMNLFVNFSYILKGFNEEDYVTILLHEALHLLFLHPITYKNKITDAVNIALDVTINQEDVINQEVLKKIGSITYELFLEILKELGADSNDVKKHSTSEYYINILENTIKQANQSNTKQITSTINNSNNDSDKDSNNNQNNNSDNNSNNNSDNNSENNSNKDSSAKKIAEMLKNQDKQKNNSHKKWKTSEDTETQVKNLVRQLKTAPFSEKEMNELTEQIKENAPGNIQKMLETYIEHGYEMKLPNFKSIISRELRKNKNKKRTIFAPKSDNGTNIIKKGFKRRYTHSQLVYFFGDTSYSINIEDIQNTITTLTKQKDKYDAKLYLFADNVYEYDKNKIQTGGTNAQAIFDFLEKKNVNPKTKIIIFSDGYIFNNINTKGYNNTIWLLTKEGTSEHLPKKHKHIKVTK
jgi:hypothetical protein